MKSNIKKEDITRINTFIGYRYNMRTIEQAKEIMKKLDKVVPTEDLNTYYSWIDDFTKFKADLYKIEKICYVSFINKVLNKTQISAIIFKAIVFNHSSLEFNDTDLSFPNICRYIKTCDSTKALDFDTYFSKWYEFKNIEEKTLYIRAFFSATKQYTLSNIPLNYDEAVHLTEEFKSAHISGNFVANNLHTFNKQQKFELLLKGAKYGAFFDLARCEIDLDQTVPSNLAPCNATQSKYNIAYTSPTL